MKQAKKIVETIQHHQAVCEIADDNSSLDTSVLLRVRPIINREKKSGYYPIAFCKDRATQIYAPNFKVLTDMSIDVNHFRFTGNYGQTTTQIEFLESFHGVVDRTMARSGMFTCFAYGQTGSGNVAPNYRKDVQHICDYTVDCTANSIWSMSSRNFVDRNYWH